MRTTCSLATRGVVVNFDLGGRFPRPRPQQRGSLRPRARRVAVLGVGAGGSRPLGPGVSPPGSGKIFFEISDAKCRVWGQFGPENKLIEGQPNEYDVMCRHASVLAFHLWPTIFARAPFRLQNISRNAAFHRVPAPLHRCLRLTRLEISSVQIMRCKQALSRQLHARTQNAGSRRRGEHN